MTEQRHSGPRVKDRFVWGALVSVLVSLSLSAACENSVVLGDPPEKDVPAIGTCSGEGCSDALEADASEETGRDSSVRGDTSGERRDAGADGSLPSEGAICGLDADESRVVNGVIRAAVRSLYETLSHSGEVRPAVVLFPGRVYLDDRVASTNYQNCQPESRSCGAESTSRCILACPSTCAPSVGSASPSRWGSRSISGWTGRSSSGTGR